MLTIGLAWQGADFIAQHLGGTTFLKVQLKARLTFEKKYRGRDLQVCFPDGHDWHLYPHDELKKMKQRLERYKLEGTGTTGVQTGERA